MSGLASLAVSTGVAAPDQRLDRVVHVPDVDVHAGQHAALAEPERDELAPLLVAAEDHLVVAAGLHVAGVLHAEVVLVGVEVRQPVVDGLLAEHGLGRGLTGWFRALAQCSTLMLDFSSGW